MRPGEMGYSRRMRLPSITPQPAASRVGSMCSALVSASFMVGSVRPRASMLSPLMSQPERILLFWLWRMAVSIAALLNRWGNFRHSRRAWKISSGGIRPAKRNRRLVEHAVFRWIGITAFKWRQCFRSIARPKEPDFLIMGELAGLAASPALLALLDEL